MRSVQICSGLARRQACEKYVPDVGISPDARQACWGYLSAVSYYPAASIAAGCTGAIRLLRPCNEVHSAVGRHCR